MMDSSDFLQLLRALTHLSSTQLERAQQHIQHHLHADLLRQSLSEHHGEEPICCPHCHSVHVIHWGQSHGSLRYRCKECHRTFNQLTDSSLSGLRRKEKWVAYAQCLNDGMTLQATADKCHINLKTSFRWRHRFLRYALTTGAKKLCGIVEADEMFIAESFKGSRHLEREPRKHGGNGHGSIPLVPVLIALDRYENETETVLLDKSYQQIAPAIEPLISRGSVLCTDGNQSYIQVAENAGVIHKRLIISDKKRVEDEVYHIQTLNNYISRLRGWMARFHGVGTDYLKNYLAWFRVKEQRRDDTKSWLLGGMKVFTNT
jgi:transposase-like protein